MGQMRGKPGRAWALGLAAGLLTTLLASSARVEAGPPAGGGDVEGGAGLTPAMIAAVDADALALAKAVRGCEPAAILVAVDDDGLPVMQRLAAVRGAAWLGRPEAALGPLARVMVGRDSLLAPAAAAAVRQIIARVGAAELSAAEVSREDLADARSALNAVAGAGTLRPDLRAVAQEALAWLDGLSLRPPEKKKPKAGGEQPGTPAGP